MDWSLTLLRIALAFYCLGFINSFLPILGRVRTQRFTPWLAGAGWVAHTLALVALGAALKRCPLGTVPEVLSALAWSAVLVYLAVFWRYRLEVLHVVILPLVLVILFAVAALSITFAASVAYVLLDRALKSKRPGRFFFKLPSLESCDSVGQISLFWAFPLMTLGIVTGAVVSASINHTFWAWAPRETLAVIAWVILAVVVAARLG